MKEGSEGGGALYPLLVLASVVAGPDVQGRPAHGIITAGSANSACAVISQWLRGRCK